MLTRFEVEGFRNFSRRYVLDLSDVRDYRFNSEAIEDGVVSCGLMYGRNAVGKTNFGNALLDISTNVGRNVLYDNEANYLCASSDAKEASFRYCFRFDEDEIDYRYTKTGVHEYVKESLAVNGELVFDYSHAEGALTGGNLALAGAQHLNWEFKAPQISIVSYICNNTPLNLSTPTFKLYRFARSMNGIADTWMTNRSFVEYLADKVIKENLVEQLQDFLQDFGVDEELVARETPSGDQALYFAKQRLIPFAQNCSSGTVALLRLFNYFHSTTAPSLLFVDEFDAFYHHDLAEKVVAYFKAQKGRQIICASHNTDLFSNKILRPDCLFILSENGIVSAANATKRELREGHNLEKLYKAGEFDG